MCLNVLKSEKELLNIKSKYLRTRTEMEYCNNREMGAVSMEATMPAINPELKLLSMTTPLMESATSSDRSVEIPNVDKYLSCPICMQFMKDAFLTSCGHSFCYLCIMTYFKSKSDCPCCAHPLTRNQLFPNFALQKLLDKVATCKLSKHASPVEHLRHSLEQDCDVTIQDLDSLISVLAKKKKKMEQEDIERNMQILMEFLQCLLKRKVGELNEVRIDLQNIKDDIVVVQKHRDELQYARDEDDMEVKVLDDGLYPKEKCLSSYNSSEGMTSRHFCGKKIQVNDHLSSNGVHEKKMVTDCDSKYRLLELFVVKKKRLQAQFMDLQDCYLEKRRQRTPDCLKIDGNMPGEFYNAGLEDFNSVLLSFSEYSQLKVIAEIGHGDVFHSANIVSSIEFDCDDEFFATAGVSRRIKVFDFSSVVDKAMDMHHHPILEMPTRSKVSCLSWNKFVKNQVASSDYEGVVNVWDVTTRQSMVQFEEHTKRVWSVDFSQTESSMLLSGSDDCQVKVWSTNQEASILKIHMKANICCVKYNPGNSNFIAVGSADHNVYSYDLRNFHHPLHVFNGHGKAVSYVNFISNYELVSASTDNTLRLWDVKKNLPVRTFVGHTNEKNFVGLTVSNQFIGCGSEKNEVFVYHKDITKPILSHNFGSLEMGAAADDSSSNFISTVCWKKGSPIILAANSRGIIKVLSLA